MIEVHIFNAFLQPAIRGTSWFTALNFINGMVAPSFIFISGFAFVISTEKKIIEIRTFNELFRKKFFRIVQILFTGYLVHIPSFSLRNIIFYTDAESFKSFYNVDVLQCISVGILLLLIARMIISPDKLYILFIIMSIAVTVMLAPFIWNIDFSRFMPLPLACYFNEVHGSYFPVFPWLGFLFSGAGTALIIQKYRENGKEDNFMMKAAIVGVFCIAVSFPMLSWLKNYSWFEVKTSPVFFVQRIGVIFVLLFLLTLYVKFRGEGESFFFHIGRESLLIYWLHLVIIYRIVFNGRNINSIVNRSFGVSECIIATTAMVLLMLAVAIIWGRIKKYHSDTGRKIFITFLTTGLILFCLS